MIWKYETRECIHFAISNFLFPYMPTHLRCSLSLFSHPKNQQHNCLSCLGITCLFLPPGGVTGVCSARMCFRVGGRRASSSSPSISKTLSWSLSSYLHLMCQFCLPVGIETKSVSAVFSIYPSIKANTTSLSLCPPAVITPPCTERAQQLYWGLLFQRLHYFYKICCSTFTNALWSIINN